MHDYMDMSDHARVFGAQVVFPKLHLALPIDLDQQDPRIQDGFDKLMEIPTKSRPVRAADVTRCSSARSAGLAGAAHLVHSSLTLPPRYSLPDLRGSIVV